MAKRRNEPGDIDRRTVPNGNQSGRDIDSSSQTRRTFTDEFKQSSINAFSESGLSKAAFEREQGLSAGSISRWQKKFEPSPSPPPQPHVLKVNDPNNPEGYIPGNLPINRDPDYVRERRQHLDNVFNAGIDAANRIGEVFVRQDIENQEFNDWQSSNFERQQQAQSGINNVLNPSAYIPDSNLPQGDEVYYANIEQAKENQSYSNYLTDLWNSSYEPETRRNVKRLESRTFVEEVSKRQEAFNRYESGSITPRQDISSQKNAWTPESVRSFERNLAASGVNYSPVQTGPDTLIGFRIQQETRHGRKSNSFVQLDHYGNIIVSSEGREHSGTYIPAESHIDVEGITKKVREGKMSVTDAQQAFDDSIVSNQEVFFKHLKSGKPLMSSVYDASKKLADDDDDSAQGFTFPLDETLTDQKRSRAANRIIVRQQDEKGRLEKPKQGIIHDFLKVTGLGQRFSNDGQGAGLDKIDARQEVNYAGFNVTRRDGTVERFDVMEKAKRTKQMGEADQYVYGHDFGEASDRVQRAWRTTGERDAPDGYKKSIAISARNTIVQEGSALGRREGVVWRNENVNVTQEQLDRLGLQEGQVFRGRNSGGIQKGKDQEWSKMSAFDLADEIGISNVSSYQAVALAGITQKKDGTYDLSFRKGIEAGESSIKRDSLKYNVATVGNEVMDSLTRRDGGESANVDYIGSASGEKGLFMAGMTALGIDYTTEELQSIMIAKDLGKETLSALAQGDSPASQRASEIFDLVQQRAGWVFDSPKYEQPEFLQGDDYVPDQYLPSQTLTEAEYRLKNFGETGELEGYSAVIMANLGADYARANTETMNMAGVGMSLTELAYQIKAGGDERSLAEIQTALAEGANPTELLNMQTDIMVNGKMTGERVSTFQNLQAVHDESGALVGYTANVTENMTRLNTLWQPKPEHFGGKMRFSQEMLDNMALTKPEAFQNLLERNNAGEFNNWAFNLMQSVMANDTSTDSGKLARAHTPTIDASELDVTGAMERAQERVGKDPSYKLDRAFLEELAESGGDVNTSIKVGDFILPSVSTALANLTENKDGDSVQNFASAFRDTLVASSNYDISGNEYDKKARDANAWNTVYSANKSIGKSVTRAAAGIEAIAVGGAASPAGVLEANEIAMTKDQLFRMSGAKTDDERQQVLDAINAEGDDQLTALSTMYPHANPDQAYHNLKIRLVEDINEQYGKTVLDPTENNVYVSQGYTHAHGKDYDADQNISILSGSWVGKGENRRFVRSKGGADTIKDILDTAESDPSGEVTKQLKEKFTSISDRLFGKVNEEGKREGGVFARFQSREETAQQHMDTLYSKGQMGLMYNVGIRGMYNMAQMMTDNKIAIAGTSRAAQVPYQAAIDAAASQDENLQRYREMFSNMNLNSRSNPNKSQGMIFHPDAAGDDKFEFIAGNYENLARELIQTSTGMMMSTEDKELYDDVIAEQIAIANIPLSILNSEDESIREEAISGLTGYLKKRRDVYAKDKKDIFKFDDYIASMGRGAEGLSASEMAFGFDSKTIDNTTTALGTLVGRAAMKNYNSEKTNYTPESFAQRWSNPVNQLRQMAETADQGRVANKQSNLDTFIKASRSHIGRIGDWTRNFVGRLMGKDAMFESIDNRPDTQSTMAQRLAAKAPAGVAPTPFNEGVYQDEYSGQQVIQRHVTADVVPFEEGGASTFNVNPNLPINENPTNSIWSTHANPSDLNYQYALAKKAAAGDKRAETEGLTRARLKQQMASNQADQVLTELGMGYRGKGGSNQDALDTGNKYHDAIQQNLLRTSTEVRAQTDTQGIRTHGRIDAFLPTSENSSLITDIKTSSSQNLLVMSPEALDDKFGAQLGAYAASEVVAQKVDGRSVRGDEVGVWLINQDEETTALMDAVAAEKPQEGVISDAQRKLWEKFSADTDTYLGHLQKVDAVRDDDGNLVYDKEGNQVFGDRYNNALRNINAIAEQNKARFGGAVNAEGLDFRVPVHTMSSKDAIERAEMASEFQRRASASTDVFDKSQINKDNPAAPLTDEQTKAYAAQQRAINTGKGQVETPLFDTDISRENQEQARMQAAAQGITAGGRPVVDRESVNTPRPTGAGQPPNQPPPSTPGLASPPDPERPEGGRKSSLSGRGDQQAGWSGSDRETLSHMKDVIDLMKENAQGNKEVVASLQEMSQMISSTLGDSSGGGGSRGGNYPVKIVDQNPSKIGEVQGALNFISSAIDGGTLQKWQEFGSTVEQVTTNLANSTDAQKESMAQIVKSYEIIKQAEGEMNTKTERGGKVLSDREQILSENIKANKAYRQLGFAEGDGRSIVDAMGEVAGQMAFERKMGIGGSAKTALSFEEREAKLMGALLAGGSGGRIRRAKAKADGLYDPSGDKGDIGGIDILGLGDRTTVTDPGRLDALAAAARFTNRAQGMLWAGSHIQHMIAQPLMATAERYEQIESARNISMMGAGAVGYDDVMGGAYGNLRRRQIRGEQFDREFGRRIYNTFGGLMGMGGEENAGTAALAASIAAPAVGGLAMINAMGISSLANPLIGAGLAGAGAGAYMLGVANDKGLMAETLSKIRDQNGNIDWGYTLGNLGESVATGWTMLLDPEQRKNIQSDARYRFGRERAYQRNKEVDWRNVDEANLPATDLLQGPDNLSKAEVEAIDQAKYMGMLQNDYLLNEDQSSQVYSFMRRYNPLEVKVGGSLSTDIAKLTTEGLINLPDSAYTMAASRGIDTWDDQGILNSMYDTVDFFDGMSSGEKIRERERLDDTSRRNISVNQTRRIAGFDNRDDYFYTSQGAGANYNVDQRDVMDSADIATFSQYVMSPEFAEAGAEEFSINQTAMIDRGQLANAYRDQQLFQQSSGMFNNFMTYNTQLQQGIGQRGMANSLSKWRGIENTGLRNSIYMAGVQGDQLAFAQLQQQGVVGNDIKYGLVNAETGMNVFARGWGDQAHQSGWVKELRNWDQYGFFDGVTDDQMTNGDLFTQQNITAMNRSLQKRSQEWGLDSSAGQYAMTTGGRGREYLQSLEDLGDAIDPVAKGFETLGEIFEKYGSKYEEGLGMSMWDIQDEQLRMSREQQMFSQQQSEASFGLQEKGLDLRIRQFYEQTGLQRRQMDYGYAHQQREMGIGRGIQQQQEGWRQEDWAFSRAQSEIGFGWQMEDFDRSMRYARGRERRDIMRQQERSVIQFAMQASKSDIDKGRLEQQEEWSADQYEREKAHFEKTKQFEEESFAMKIRHFEEDIALQREQMELSRQRIQMENQWRQEQWQLEDERIRMERQWYTFQFENQEAINETAKENADIIYELQQMMTGLSTYTQEASSSLQVAVKSGEEFEEIMKQFPNQIDTITGAITTAMTNSVKDIGDAFVEYGEDMQTFSEDMQGARRNVIEFGKSALQITSDMKNSVKGEVTKVASGGYTDQSGNFSHKDPNSVVVLNGKEYLYSDIFSASDYSNSKMLGGYMESYAKGGYTGMGGIGIDAGIVHAGEYVVPSGGVPIVRGDNPEQVQLLKKMVQLLTDIKNLGPGRVNATIYTQQEKVETSDINDVYRVM